MIFLILFIVSTLLLGSVYVGPASMRVWMTVLMFFILIYQSAIKGKKGYRSLNTMVPLVYVLFILSMVISLLFNGEFNEFGFFRRFWAYYFVCFVSYYAVGYFITDKQSAHHLLITLLIIVTFNNLLAVLQYFSIPVGWSVGNFFSDVTSREEFADSHSEILGFSIIPGAFGDPVMSGFITAILAPLLFAKIKENKSVLLLLVQIVIIGINLYGCFVTQQRIAFVLFLFSGIIIALKYVRQHPVVSLFVVLCIIASFSYIVTGLEAFEWGRLFSLNNDTRSRLWNQAITFIQEHPIFGGPMAFQRQAGLSSHNMFLDSIIFSGIGGFLFLSVLWGWCMFLAIKNMILGLLSKSSHLTFLLSISLFNTMIYGLFHNTSLLMGYNINFVVLAFFLCAIRIDKSLQNR